MLSPHELTTLMLINDAPEQIEPGRIEIRTLLAYDLVVWETLSADNRAPRVTPQGQAILHAVGRIPRDVGDSLCSMRQQQ